MFLIKTFAIQPLVKMMIRFYFFSIFQFLYKYETIAKEHQTNVIEALKKDQKKYPITIQGYIHWLEKWEKLFIEAL